MSLHAVVGHEEERASLSAAFARGLLPAALLIQGPRGVGKQRLALWLAQLLVCEAPAEEPCHECRYCRMAVSLEHPDVHWYFPLERPKQASKERMARALEDARLETIADRRSHPLQPVPTGEVRGLYVATARSIRERAHMKPVLGSGPVFVVGDADLLVPQEASQEAANALLKLLEEPPGGSRFVLTSSEPGRLLATIRSRTTPLHLGPLDTQDVASFLEREAEVEAEAAGWAASISQGSPGRALGFLSEADEPGPLERLRRRAFDIVVAATARDDAEAYALALTFPPAGARGLVELFAFVEEWLRDLAAVTAGATSAVLNRDSVHELERCADGARLAAFDVATAFGAVEQARELARGNVNPQLVVSGLVRELRAALRGRPRVEEVA